MKIKKWNQFNEGQFNNLTYDEALLGIPIDKAIKKHIEENYPEHFYTKDGKNLLGRYGHELNKTNVNKISALARKNDDTELSKLATDWFDHNVKMTIISKKRG